MHSSNQHGYEIIGRNIETVLSQYIIGNNPEV